MKLYFYICRSHYLMPHGVYSPHLRSIILTFEFCPFPFMLQSKVIFPQANAYYSVDGEGDVKDILLCFSSIDGLLKAMVCVWVVLARSEKRHLPSVKLDVVVTFFWGGLLTNLGKSYGVTCDLHTHSVLCRSLKLVIHALQNSECY